MTTNQIGMAFNAFIDDDTFATATADNIASSESIKAYVDAQSGTPGGSNTQIQYNNAGAFGGDTGFTTNGAGVLTAASLAWSDNTLGLVGTATNDAAGAGYVGESTSAIVNTGSAVSLTTATTANVTSISLTAGDWDVWGYVGFTGTATITSGFNGGIGATSATMPSVAAISNAESIALNQGSGVGFATYGGTIVTPPQCRITLSGTTTIYLLSRMAFSGGTASAYGTIRARRRR